MLQVNIQVLDVNDNSPVFTRHVYARKLAESVSMGTVVEVVRANDADIGNNGEVSYSISVGNDEGNWFTFDFMVARCSA